MSETLDEETRLTIQVRAHTRCGGCWTALLRRYWDRVLRSTTAPQAERRAPVRSCTVCLFASNSGVLLDFSKRAPESHVPAQIALE